ncbi:guanylate kinase [hydrocarbon metagenome]|uniref:Guanylate kinase n=1 Tax=hydrocarbon metagenome TaxID=938273 RepID=A0A0W8G0P3_9ZZZZ
MEKTAKLFVFSAPSGSGKTTIIRKILDEYNELVFSISATTRKRRGAEIEGKDYFFISEDEFLKKIENDEFIEWEKFYDYYYGTLKRFVENQLQIHHSVLLEVDVKGALKIKEKYPNSILIFIAPPNKEVLKERLINRKTETKEDLLKRIKRAEMELEYKDKFDYVVINNELNDAIEQVKKIINKEINS